jgi:SAM-dependent methyltransferase
MSYSQEWNNVYKDQRQYSIWPWTDLVSLFMSKFSNDIRPDLKVLEMGCGSGANIPFFEDINIDYHAIDGSSEIINLLNEKFINLNIVCADFTKEIPFDQNFDIIFDRASISCNTVEGIKSCIKIIESKLISGGYFMGTDWFSTESSYFTNPGSGTINVDEYTLRINESPFLGAGNVQFTDEAQIRKYCKNFEITYLSHKSKENKFTGETISVWDFIGKLK